MRRLCLVIATLCAALPLPARATTVFLATSGDAYATIEGSLLRVGNGAVERAWAIAGGGSVLTDKRRPFGGWVALDDGTFNGVAFRSEVSGATATVRPDGGIDVTVTYQQTAPIRLTRRVRVLPGVAAIRMQQVVSAPVPLVLTSYSLEHLRPELSVGSLTATAIGFNGGADWHSDTGFDYRQDHNGPFVDANAEWLHEDAGRLALLMERRNYLSSRMRWGIGSGAEAAVDLAYDALYLGPIEPYVVANPTRVPARSRKVVLPDQPLALEPVIAAMGSSVEELQWQAHRMLMSDRQPYANTVNFNTDRVHTDNVDVGARDGVNFTEFQNLLPVAERMGVETFILDDGWQLYNGDWRQPDLKRYPDGLGPVRDALHARGMRLGLWMAPGAFHPFSQLFAEHPEWACTPTGDGTAAVNALQPEDGSNAAGIGLWNMNAIGPAGSFRDRLRSDIDNLVESLNVAEFKFDFLVWVDCVNPMPADIYDYHDTFFSVIDSLAGDHPQVGFGLDETNDFRGFPFESILRGATWFQNGNPRPDELLHNLWLLQPYVPGFAIGQAVTIEPGLSPAQIDERMAVAMGSHITFWTDIRTLKDETAITSRVKIWTDFFKQHRALNGFSFPLLDDPIGGANWGGLQPWNPATNSGYAMLYRFQAANATQAVSFRGVDAGGTYTLTDITPVNPGGMFGTFSGAALRAGIPITIGSASGVRIFRIDPA